MDTEGWWAWMWTELISQCAGDISLCLFVFLFFVMFVRYTYTHSHFRGIHGDIYCNKQLFSVYNVTFLIIFAIFFKMIGVNVILVNVTVTTGVVHHINYEHVPLTFDYHKVLTLSIFCRCLAWEVWGLCMAARALYSMKANKCKSSPAKCR